MCGTGGSGFWNSVKHLNCSSPITGSIKSYFANNQSDGLIYGSLRGTLASYLLGDSVLQFSTIIGCYLFAMGIGDALSRYIDRGLAYQFCMDRTSRGCDRGIFFCAVSTIQDFLP